MSERTSLTTVNTALRDEAYTRALSMGTLKDLETEIDRRHASMTNAFEQMGDECKISAITEFGDKTPAQITESFIACLLYTSPSPRDRQKSRMPSSA